MTKLLEGVITQGTGAGYTYMGCAAEAGKTGTSEDLSDAWFVGYTPLYSTAVWVGHPQSREATGFGGPTAGPIWRSFMESAAAGNCPEFAEPSSLPELSGLDSEHTSGSSGSYERRRRRIRIRRRRIRRSRRSGQGQGRRRCGRGSRSSPGSGAFSHPDSHSRAGTCLAGRQRASRRGRAQRLSRVGVARLR